MHQLTAAQVSTIDTRKNVKHQKLKERSDSPAGPVFQPVQIQHRFPGASQPSGNLFRLEGAISRTEIVVDQLCDFFSSAWLLDFV